LESAPVLAIEDKIVIGLQELVVELDERQAALQALPVRFGGEHAVHAEMYSDLAQERDVLEREEPVGVVFRQRPARIKVQVAVKLGVDQPAVGPDLVLSQHLAHLGLATGVAHHGRAASYKGDRAVSRALQVHHGHDRYQASGVQAGRCAVKADVECHGSAPQHIAHGVLVGHLGDEPAPGQRVVGVLGHSVPPQVGLCIV